MKRLIILLIASALAGSGVNIGEYIPDGPHANTVAVCNRSLTFEMPEEMTIQENPVPSYEYSAFAHFTDKNGEDTMCHIYAVRFFLEEEKNFKYDMLDEYIVSINRQLLPNNVQVDFIHNDYQFGESATGHITYVYYKGLNRYTAYIRGEGVYYLVGVDFSAEVDESILLDMVRSVQIDNEAEKIEVDAFEARIENDRYYSADMENVSVHLPYGWIPTESSCLLYQNCILSIAGEIKGNQLTVRIVDKSTLGVINIDELYEVLYDEMILRGYCDGVEDEYVQVDKRTEAGIKTTIQLYDSDLIRMDCIMQDDDYYYILEGVVTNNHYDIVMQMIDIILSFDAEGIYNNY